MHYGSIFRKIRHTTDAYIYMLRKGTEWLRDQCCPLSMCGSNYVYKTTSKFLKKFPLGKKKSHSIFIILLSICYFLF